MGLLFSPNFNNIMTQTAAAGVQVIPAHKRRINKVAVLGSGIMGSRIACHFANIGCEVLLLDIVPFDLKDEEKDDPKARNRLVNDSLKTTFKSNPASLYKKDDAAKITTGNFDDDLAKIADCDWVIEVVIERLDIKKQVFEKVEKYRKPGTLITSNTSGIPIHSMLEGRSEDFRAHFVGTHFFNPPRYLRLLEIIPTPETDQAVVDFLMHYGDLFLGKQTVLCKDTPAFIANRIGIFSIMTIFKLMEEMDMTVEEIDALTGPIAGRPKSATFRTVDVVGLDTLVKVAKGVYDNCPHDEHRDMFEIPAFIQKMEENKWLGSKSGQGFYKKNRTPEGKKEILALNVKTMEYAPKSKPRFKSIGAAKPVDDLKKRIKVLHATGDKGSKFLNQLGYYLFQYVSNRIPEVSNEVYQIDDALKAGFGWELGPFEYWDVLGVEKTVKEMEKAGLKPADWVYKMLEEGITSFYKPENGQRKVYDPALYGHYPVPNGESFLILDSFRNQEPVLKNDECTVHDIGDGVMCVEFHSKMNAIGGGILQGINDAINIAEDKGWKGVVLGNDAANFSAGANLGMIFMLAIEQEFDELEYAVRMFQNTVMRCRYSSIPVVAAPHGLTLGGGCEFTMHCDRAVAAAETYIGLVEVGAGVIPGGGGTKEFVLRVSDKSIPSSEINALQDALMVIGQAKVATSAKEAFDLGILEKGNDKIAMNQGRQIADAKAEVLKLYNDGYTMPQQRTDIKVLGRRALGSLLTGVDGMVHANYISEHDALIAGKLAYVMCGGDLSESTKVSEQYLLDLEREAFLQLLGEKKSLERIQSILQTGKPLRN